MAASVGVIFRECAGFSSVLLMGVLFCELWDWFPLAVVDGCVTVFTSSVVGCSFLSSFVPNESVLGSSLIGDVLRLLPQLVDFVSRLIEEMLLTLRSILLLTSPLV